MGHHQGMLCPWDSVSACTTPYRIQLIWSYLDVLTFTLGGSSHRVSFEGFEVARPWQYTLGYASD